MLNRESSNNFVLPELVGAVDIVFNRDSLSPILNSLLRMQDLIGSDKTFTFLSIEFIELVAGYASLGGEMSVMAEIIKKSVLYAAENQRFYEKNYVFMFRNMRKDLEVYETLRSVALELVRSGADVSAFSLAQMNEVDRLLGTKMNPVWEEHQANFASPVPEGEGRLWPGYDREARESILMLYIKQVHAFACLPQLDYHEMLTHLAWSAVDGLRKILWRPNAFEKRDLAGFIPSLNALAQGLSVNEQSLCTEILKEAFAQTFTTVNVQLGSGRLPIAYEELLLEMGFTDSQIAEGYKVALLIILRDRQYANHVGYNMVEAFLQKLGNQKLAEFENDPSYLEGRNQAIDKMLGYYNKGYARGFQGLHIALRTFRAKPLAGVDQSVMHNLRNEILKLSAGFLVRHTLEELTDYFAELKRVFGFELHQHVSLTHEGVFISIARHGISADQVNLLTKNLDTLGISLGFDRKRDVAHATTNIERLLSIFPEQYDFKAIVKYLINDPLITYYAVSGTLKVTPALAARALETGLLLSEVESVLDHPEHSAEELVRYIDKKKTSELVKLVSKHNVQRNFIAEVDERLETWVNDQETNVWPKLQSLAGFLHQNTSEDKAWRMALRFVSRHDVTRHDVLTQVQNIIKLGNIALELAQVTPQQFFGNLMVQVILDRNVYQNDGNSYSEFSLIAAAFDQQIVLSMLKNKHLAETAVQELLKEIHSWQDVFKSWSNLRTTYKAMQIFADKNLVVMIEEYREAYPYFADYMQTLLQHPEVSIAQIRSMLKTPDKYLAGGIDRAFMPSNFENIPGLHWTAKDIVITSTDPKSERIKRVPKMTIKFTVASPENSEEKLEIFVCYLPKSAAIAELGGNMTKSCMSFGRTKQIQYRFSWSFGVQQIMIRTGEQGWHALTQSLLTEDLSLPAGVKVKDLYNSLKKQANLSSLLPDEFLVEDSRHLSYDNIEVGRAYSANEEWEVVLRSIFIISANLYREEYATKLGWDTKKSLLGRHADDELNMQVNFPNNTIPGAGISYSDKVGSKVIAIAKNTIVPAANKILNIEVIEAEEVGYSSRAVNYIGDVSTRDITYADALKLAYIADKQNTQSTSSFDSYNNILNGAALYSVYKDYPLRLGRVIFHEGKMRGFVVYYLGESDEQTLICQQEIVIDPGVEPRLAARLRHTLEQEIMRDADDLGVQIKLNLAFI